LAIPLDDLTNWDELSKQVVDLIQAELEKNPHRRFTCVVSLLAVVWR
jgi:hypothetical protein